MNLSAEAIDIGIRRGRKIVGGLGHRIPWIEYYQATWHTFEGHQVLLNGLCNGCSQRFKVVHFGAEAEIYYYTERWKRLWCMVDLNERWFTNKIQNEHEDHAMNDPWYRYRIIITNSRRVQYNYFYDHIYQVIIAIAFHGAMGHVVRVSRQ